MLFYLDFIQQLIEEELQGVRVPTLNGGLCLAGPEGCATWGGWDSLQKVGQMLGIEVSMPEFAASSRGSKLSWEPSCSLLPGFLPQSSGTGTCSSFWTSSSS